MNFIYSYPQSIITGLHLIKVSFKFVKPNSATLNQDTNKTSGTPGIIKNCRTSIRHYQQSPDPKRVSPVFLTLRSVEFPDSLTTWHEYLRQSQMVIMKNLKNYFRALQEHFLWPRSQKHPVERCRSCKRGSSRRTKSKWIIFVGKCWECMSEARWLATWLASSNISIS